MAHSVTVTSRRWIDGDCYEVVEKTSEGKTTLVSQSPEPQDRCPPRVLIGRKGASKSSSKLPLLLLAGAGAVGLVVFLRSRRKSGAPTS